MPSKHPKYGNTSYMVFQVEETLFHFPMRLLKQSQYFRDLIEEAHTGSETEGKSNENPICLARITAFEMASFLDVLEASYLYGDPQLSFKQWASALHMATMWAFDDIRDRIIMEMDKMISTQDPFDRIDLSFKFRVEKWLHPAYEALCQRSEGLNAEEIERLGPSRTVSCASCGNQWNVRQIFRKDVNRVVQRMNFGYPALRASNAMDFIKDESGFQYA
ncbi:hypothetical protein FS837_012200 [Tulasnella sp. UAMH 9824]|nr:hypothetical protein FS837_012200 [Tulasnella sp. UAMH 9824]